ncbi:ExbD/TolR family protein [Paracoccus aminovorans]|uniref:ExbD/TolR family protein n=1 Tax=Paracoccus aminovorans TaxID=34004 RepID=UPI000783E9BE|nr:biopolymer transporter ExbD [Paracoccus aminovorans]MDQ7774639.1 biopolymer transporter ExbD [Paracoccus aminovorans]
MQVARPSIRPPGLDLPRRPRRRGFFAMTALADVLFQLLIFFMVSASLVSYSLLPLRSGALRDSGGGAAAGEEAPQAGTTLTEARATAVWTLNPGGITASGQQFALPGVAALADALAAQGTRNVLIVLRPAVPVQDLVQVLEILSARGIDSVQIAEAPGGAG